MIIDVFNKAKNIIFDKVNSKLSATNVQDAITELTPVVLWENKGEYTDATAVTTVTLASGDYLFYEVISTYAYGNSALAFSSGKIPKGSGTYTGYNYPTGTASNGVCSAQKRIDYVSATQLRFQPTTYGYTTKAAENSNLVCPKYVIGYKA